MIVYPATSETTEYYYTLANILNLYKNANNQDYWDTFFVRLMYSA